MSVFLKVKVKSLAAEARIIKREEQRIGCATVERQSLVSQLSQHRKHTVRREARHSLLAMGYLRGRTYSAMEQTCHRDPDWEAVHRMIKKYGPPKHNVSFEAWKTTSPATSTDE